MEAQQRLVGPKISGSDGREVFIADRARRSEQIFRPLGFALAARSQKDIGKHARPSTVPVVERVNLHGPMMEHYCLFEGLDPSLFPVRQIIQKLLELLVNQVPLDPSELQRRWLEPASNSW